MTGRTVLSAFVIGLLLTTVSCSTMGHRKKEAVAQYKLGVSQFLAGNNQAAYVRFQEALRLDPNNKEVYNALGNVHLRLKEYEKAEKSFKKAVNLDSQFSEAHNNLCYVYYKTGRYEEAITSCERALANKVYATPEKAFYNLGFSYYRLERYDKALGAFEDALRRSPRSFQAYYGLALVYNAQGRYGKASEAMGFALGFDPRFRGNAARAEQEFMKEQTESAGLDFKDLSDYIEILHY
ncbi:MAG: tetratricopeptide repeat protein [Nitrospirota bacterium]|jgi:tetratricopeptide (TPR) repeat protein